MWTGIFIKDHEIKYVRCRLSSAECFETFSSGALQPPRKGLGFPNSLALMTRTPHQKSGRRGWKTVQPDSAVTMDAMAQKDAP